MGPPSGNAKWSFPHPTRWARIRITQQNTLTASNLARRRYKSSGTPFCFRLVGILVLRPHLMHVSKLLKHLVYMYGQTDLSRIAPGYMPIRQKAAGSILRYPDILVYHDMHGRNAMHIFSPLLNQKLLSGYRNWVGHPDRLPILTVVRRAMEPVQSCLRCDSPQYKGEDLRVFGMTILKQVNWLVNFHT